MAFSKKEIVLYNTSILALFKEFIKIINCEVEILQEEITIWDLFYTPTITLGGKTFTFDDVDIEINTLFGGNGKRYTVPFEYITNDNLRKIKCDKLGNCNVFSIQQTKLDNKNKEIDFIQFNVAQENNNLIEIHIQQEKIGVYLKFQIEKNKEISCLIRIYNYTNVIDNQIELEYKSKKDDYEKCLKIYHSYFNRLNHDHNFTTLAKFTEKPLIYASDNRNGHYLVQHTDSNKKEKIKELNLDETELDLYFEDLCFHSKEFISVLKSNLSSLNPNFLNILYQNYPDFKLFLEKIENSQDRGILNNILNAYLKRKEELGLKRELKFISNQNMKK